MVGHAASVIDLRWVTESRDSSSLREESQAEARWEQKDPPLHADNCFNIAKMSHRCSKTQISMEKRSS